MGQGLYFVAQAKQADPGPLPNTVAHELYERHRLLEARVTALENILLERQREAAGGLSFPLAQGGELGLCETIEPLPAKRHATQSGLSFVAVFCVVAGLLVALLASL